MQKEIFSWGGDICLVKQYEKTNTRISRTEEVCNQNGQTHSNNSSPICQRINCLSVFDYFVGLARKGLTSEKGVRSVIELDKSIQFSDEEKFTRAEICRRWSVSE